MKQAAALILCAIAGTAAMGAASAAPQDEDALSRVVKFRSDSLLTDSGAHLVYRKIVSAAEQVCPQSAGSRLVSEVVLQCRAQASAHAVMKSHDSRLAAIHLSASRSS
jgi:UrcA family protein